MSELRITANLIAFFALQCFTLGMIIFTISYVMKPLLDRWQAQAEALAESSHNDVSNRVQSSDQRNL